MTEQSDKKVKRLPVDVKKFTANGRKYHVANTLSVERWRFFEDFQSLVGFGRTHDEIYEGLKKTHEALNKSKVADAVVHNHNLMIGIHEKLQDRHHVALKLCALFINYDGEDEKVYDEEDMKMKINDWQEAGYSMQDFFSLAFTLVPGFLANYNDILQNISSLKEETKPSPSKEKK